MITSINDAVEVAPKPAASLASKIKQSTAIYLTGTFRRHRKLRDIRHFIEYLYEHAITRIVSTSYMFQDCENLTDISPLAYLPTNHLINASFMFSWCYRLTDLSPLAEWDMSRIRNIHAMFLNCTSLSDLTPLMNWSVDTVRKTGYVFCNCPITEGVDTARRIDPSYTCTINL